VVPSPENESIDWSSMSGSGAPADTISGGSTGRDRVSTALAVAVLGGVLLGAAGMHLLDSSPSTPAANPLIDVRVSLGVMAGEPGAMSIVAGDPVVSIPLVVTNAGQQSLTLTMIRVSGPGASLVTDPGGRPAQMLPWTLASGRPVDTRVAVRSDCAVAVRPAPRVILVLQDSRGLVHDLPVTVPDLDNVWGETLIAPACGLR
jgi:hypothetical protein